MAAIRRTDTKPEIAIRRALHHQGLRFRKDLAVRADGLLVRPDIVFTRQKIAVFVDGCFWHSCPEHGRHPSKNAQYWSPKLQKNAERDRLQTAALESDGWTVLRFWEHEDLDVAVQRVAAAVTRLREIPR